MEKLHTKGFLLHEQQKMAGLIVGLLGAVILVEVGPGGLSPPGMAIILSQTFVQQCRNVIHDTPNPR